MIRFPRVTWTDGAIQLKIQIDGVDHECVISRNMAFVLLIDLARALLFGERE